MEKSNSALIGGVVKKKSSAMGDIGKEISAAMGVLDDERNWIDRCLRALKDKALGAPTPALAGRRAESGMTDDPLLGESLVARAAKIREVSEELDKEMGSRRRSWRGEALSERETQEEEERAHGNGGAGGHGGECEGYRQGGVGRGRREAAARKNKCGSRAIWIVGEGSGGVLAFLHHPMLDEWKVAVSAELELVACGLCGYARQSSASGLVTRARKRSGAPGSLGAV